MIRIIESSLKRYPELISFLEEKDEAELAIKAQQLKFAYYVSYQKPHYQFSAFTSPAKLCIRLQAVPQLKSLLLKSNAIHLIERAELLNAACEVGNIEIIHLLLNIPGFINPVCNPGLEAYQRAAEQGNLDILKRLLYLPTVQENLTVNNNFALLAAARNGHVHVVKHLLTYPAIANNITSMDNFALRWAYSNDHYEIVDLLLEYPKVFSYAEMQQDYYGLRYLRGFVQRWQDNLAQKQQQAGTGDLILSEREVKKSLLALHYLIYFYTPTNLDTIRMLLSIPCIRAKAHLPITNYNINELLELAYTKGHNEIIDLLLAIPHVCHLAESTSRANFIPEDERLIQKDTMNSSFFPLHKQDSDEIKAGKASKSNTINTNSR